MCSRIQPDEGAERICLTEWYTLQRGGQAEAHQGPDSPNGLHALLGLLVLGCPGRECGLGRLSRGKHRIQVAYHGIQVSGEAAQRAHRQLERAVTRRIVARRRISRFSLRWLAVGGV